MTCACTRAPDPSVAEANEAIRKYVAGRQCWAPAELEELARLWTEWRRAARRRPAA